MVNKIKISNIRYWIFDTEIQDVDQHKQRIPHIGIARTWYLKYQRYLYDTHRYHRKFITYLPTLSSYWCTSICYSYIPTFPTCRMFNVILVSNFLIISTKSDKKKEEKKKHSIINWNSIKKIYNFLRLNARDCLSMWIFSSSRLPSWIYWNSLQLSKYLNVVNEA